jgi:hypothetical protein
MIKRRDNTATGSAPDPYAILMKIARAPKQAAESAMERAPTRRDESAKERIHDK